MTSRLQGGGCQGFFNDIISQITKKRDNGVGEVKNCQKLSKIVKNCQKMGNII